jgi:septum formation protein
MAGYVKTLESEPGDLAIRLEQEQLQAKGQIDRLPSFILASASPRRRELLAAVGLTFDVHPAEIAEVPAEGEPPEQFAIRVATDKAVCVAFRYPGRLVLGADTVVALGDEILGKPRDRSDARRMLERLAGGKHRVCTAIAKVIRGGTPEAMVVVTEVAFRAMSAAEIETYIDSGEPFDKAGAYGIQGGAAGFVEAVHGSYSNVIGLPLVETIALLTRGRRQG